MRRKHDRTRLMTVIANVLTVLLYLVGTVALIGGVIVGSVATIMLSVMMFILGYAVGLED